MLLRLLLFFKREAAKQMLDITDNIICLCNVLFPFLYIKRWDCLHVGLVALLAFRCAQGTLATSIAFHVLILFRFDGKVFFPCSEKLLLATASCHAFPGFP